MPRTRSTVGVSALATGLALLTACGQPASKATSDATAVDPATQTLPPPAAEMPASPNLPAAPATPGNPLAPAGPGSPSAGTVTPPATDAAYNRGAGNANVGPGNDGSAGTRPSGSNNEANATRREPPR